MADGVNNQQVVKNMMDEITAVRDSGRAVKQKGGKLYTMVQDRIEVLRRNAGDYYRITTELLQWSAEAPGMIVVRAVIRDHGGQVVATGHAEEIRGANYINETSALENCETSAIGRALAVLGLHGGEFASADEISIAVAKRERMSNQIDAKAAVSVQNNAPVVVAQPEEKPKAEKIELKQAVKKPAAELKLVSAGPAVKQEEKAQSAANKKEIVPLQLDLEDAVKEAGGPARPLVQDHPLMKDVKPETVECVDRIVSSTPILKKSKDADLIEECFMTFIPLCSTVDECYSFWHQNEHIVDILKTDAPEAFERVRSAFVAAKAKLTKASGKKK